MTTKPPIWLPKRAMLALHDEQLERHGGPAGICDEGAFERALARPENLFAYGEPDLADLAYAYGLARNHALIDGNKRISFVACSTFLRLSNHELRAATDDNLITWLALASGTLSESDLAAWIRTRIQPPV